MNFALETRHWMVIFGTVALTAAIMIFGPYVVPIYPTTTYAFPVIATAIILDTLGATAERLRSPLKRLAWFALVVATLIALASLRDALSAMSATYLSWRESGGTILRAAWEAVISVGQYPAAHQQAIAVSVVVGVSCLTIAVLGPLLAAFDQRIGLDRTSRTGPWRAGWMSASDISHLARNQTGLPLVQYEGRILRYQKNDKRGWRGGHHLVVAGTRGGKGVSAVIPAILDHQGPVVALDIKGENFAVTRRHRQDLGRKVAVLNPFGVIEASQDRFNPLDYIRPDHLARDIAVLADGLVKPESGDAGHFSDMARKLIAAAIEVVVTNEDAKKRNLVSVMDLLLSSNLESTLTAWIENSDIVGHRPAQAANTILGTSEKERGSIISTLSKAFDWMKFDEMREFLTGSSFKLDDLLNDRADIFIVVPLDQVKDQAVFMRLFINLVLGSVVRQDGRRKVKAPVLLVLDEFVRMGRMDQIMNIANVAAGAGIEALFVTQDTGQVEQTYGRYDARSIFGSCITKRIFNVNDIETAEWAVRHIGDSTVYSQQIRQGRSQGDGWDLSYSEQRQKLMTPEQIIGMRSHDVLLLIGNRSPLKATQNLYFQSEAYRGKFDHNPLF